MSPAQIRKQIICSECGRPLSSVPVTTAAVEQEALVDDDEPEDDTIVGDEGVVVETVIERGPVCARCAAHR
jgi:hypothetical protein